MSHYICPVLVSVLAISATLLGRFSQRKEEFAFIPENLSIQIFSLSEPSLSDPLHPTLELRGEQSEEDQQEDDYPQPLGEREASGV